MTFYVVNFRKKYRTYRNKRLIKQEFHPHFLFITSRQLLWKADCTRNRIHEFLIIASLLRVEVFLYCSQHCGLNLGQCSNNISWTKYGGNKKGIILIQFFAKPWKYRCWDLENLSTIPCQSWALSSKGGSIITCGRNIRQQEKRKC